MNDNREFSLDEICLHSKELFGVYPEVIYGALLPAETKEKYTLAEIRRAIDKFVKKEVV